MPKYAVTITKEFELVIEAAERSHLANPDALEALAKRYAKRIDAVDATVKVSRQALAGGADLEDADLVVSIQPSFEVPPAVAEGGE